LTHDISAPYITRMQNEEHLTPADRQELGAIEHDLASARARKRKVVNRINQRAWRAREKAK